jgi:hypothetical protein
MSLTERLTDANGVATIDVTKDWFWEGNVVECLARYLSGDGWVIINKANTQSKERGVDIHASKRNIDLLVEVKGYPSREYRDPRRAAEQKPTNPTNQAQQWYSHALLKALRLQSKHPTAKVALAFQALFQETHVGLQKLGVAFMLVKETGKVHTWNLD